MGLGREFANHTLPLGALVLRRIRGPVGFRYFVTYAEETNLPTVIPLDWDA